MRNSDAVRAGPEIDLHSILHEEIERLPERERLPVVLCDLEGLSYEQAAGRCAAPSRRSAIAWPRPARGCVIV